MPITPVTGFLFHADSHATLQRVIILASLTLFKFVATRPHIWAGLPKRPLLVDASGGNRHSSISSASELSIKRLLDDGRGYTAVVLQQLLQAQDTDWTLRPVEALEEVFRKHLKKGKIPNLAGISDLVEEMRADGIDINDGLPERLVDAIDNSSRGVDGYLRLLGVRAGLLYPQQKNPVKRLIPSERTLEVLVASTIDVTQRPMEYRDFLDRLYDRWGMLTGGRISDALELAKSGISVPSADLTENSDRFLHRLEMLGLARRLADSVAVVGLMEGGHDNH